MKSQFLDDGSFLNVDKDIKYKVRMEQRRSFNCICE